VSDLYASITSSGGGTAYLATSDAAYMQFWLSKNGQYGAAVHAISTLPSGALAFCVSGPNHPEIHGGASILEDGTTASGLAAADLCSGLGWN
jgi:hypothetical protein